MTRPLHPAPLIIATILISCGGLSTQSGSGSFKPGETWDSREETFFDNGMDLLESPDGDFGQWGFEPKNLLDGRVQLADMVAIIEVNAINTRTDSGGAEVIHVDVDIAQRLYGSSPESRISLKSTPAHTGFFFLRRYEKELIGRFILFSRWFVAPQGEGQLGHRFHLSPASPSLVAEVKSRLALRLQLESN